MDIVHKAHRNSRITAKVEPAYCFYVQGKGFDTYEEASLYARTIKSTVTLNF